MSLIHSKNSLLTLGLNGWTRDRPHASKWLAVHHLQFYLPCMDHMG